MALFIEATFIPTCDASFDYGHGNLSFSNQSVAGTATGVSFQMTRPGSYVLVDALVWTIVFAGTVSGAPTILLEGTLDGTNWFTIDTSSAATSALRSISSHAGTGLPTHVLALRARISVAGTGSGTVTVNIAA